AACWMPMGRKFFATCARRDSRIGGPHVGFPRRFRAGKEYLGWGGLVRGSFGEGPGLVCSCWPGVVFEGIGSIACFDHCMRRPSPRSIVVQSLLPKIEWPVKA